MAGQFHHRDNALCRLLERLGAPRLPPQRKHHIAGQVHPRRHAGASAVARLQGWALAGRDTWIGATDATALLRFFGFDAVLVDFSSPEALALQQRARAQLAAGGHALDGAATAQQAPQQAPQQQHGPNAQVAPAGQPAPPQPQPQQQSLHQLWAAVGGAPHSRQPLCCRACRAAARVMMSRQQCITSAARPVSTAVPVLDMHAH